MTESKVSPRIRLGIFSFVVSAILFVVYPALRPFSDESSLEGAAAFASAEWTAAHMLAMVAFTLLPIGVIGLYYAMHKTAPASKVYWAFVLSLIGVGCLLPFYGGETYGLRAIGQEALARQSADLVGLQEVVRSGPGLMMFLVGLLMLAAASILVAWAVGKSGKYAKWSGVPFALGMLLYLPQFFAGQPLRVAHGMLVAAGCLWLAADMSRRIRA